MKEKDRNLLHFCRFYDMMAEKEHRRLMMMPEDAGLPASAE